jgi:hypothetical protein
LEYLFKNYLITETIDGYICEKCSILATLLNLRRDLKNLVEEAEKDGHAVKQAGYLKNRKKAKQGIQLSSLGHEASSTKVKNIGSEIKSKNAIQDVIKEKMQLLKTNIKYIESMIQIQKYDFELVNMN